MSVLVSLSVADPPENKEENTEGVLETLVNVFSAACGLSLVAACGLLTAVTSLVVECRL